MAAATTSTEAPPPPSPRKPGGPGQPWSDLETRHLISAYAEKWYSLKRGPLKAQQWEEVASSVPSKNGTQCRHKMEKLRKRYRAERKLPAPSLWPHFHLMDRMERGSLPPHPQPPLDERNNNVVSNDDEEDDDVYTEQEEDEEDYRNGYLAGAGSALRGAGKWISYLAPPPSPPRVSKSERGGGLATQLAVSVSRFAEQFQRIEKRRMEMMVDLERDWMDMETRRMQMFIRSQQYLVDAISSASSPHPANKKPKRSV